MEDGAGLDAGAAREFAQGAARRLSRDPRVRLVYLFGSGADATAGRVRDVDLGVHAVPPIETGELLGLRADLGTASGVEVDLVPLDRASVVLLHQVAEHGVCLFARDPGDEVAFVTRARSRYWDFAPYLAAQWDLAGERLEARRHGPEA